MASDIIMMGTRPCVILSKAQRRTSYGTQYEAVTVRFLDGRLPGTGLIGAKSLAKYKRARGSDALIWPRVDELVKQGLLADEAKRQAVAEYAKGVLRSE